MYLFTVPMNDLATMDYYPTCGSLHKKRVEYGGENQVSKVRALKGSVLSVFLYYLVKFCVIAMHFVLEIQ